MIVTFIKQLRQNKEEVNKIEKQLKQILKTLNCKLETMIGIDTVVAASLIAEIKDIKRFSNPSKLAKYSGICPVIYSSGEKERRFKNKQGNRTLYHLFHDLAARNVNRGRNKQKPVNDIFYTYYKKKISEGKTSHQALICVMRRIVNIIYGMMKNNTSYIHPETNNKLIDKIGLK